ncbi:MAG: S41 family peptidase [Deltaproteobacteria bacterium]
MKKLALYALSGTILGAVLTTQVAGPLLAQNADAEASVYEQLDLFGDVFERVRAQYVEEVDPQKLIEAAINGMLTSLDPHSSFMDAKFAAEMRESTKGEFGGIGIEVTQQDGFVKIVTPMDGTPGADAGLTSGDFITHVNGESLLGLTMDQSIEKMKGPVGSDVTLTIVRPGTDNPFNVKITRDTIKQTSVRTRTEGKAVVLRVAGFNEQTYPNLEEGIKKAIEESGGLDNINGFVVDLRNNPGGLLTQAIAVSDAFLESGEIVSTRGRNPNDGQRYSATPGDLALGKPVVVLINGGSASASEIVAGALKDQKRAVVIGTTSFGKGSVQTVMPLRGDAAMRLTTARYYTPSGRSIQGLGVSPDIVVEQPPRAPEADADAVPDPSVPKMEFESDLRGSLSNDSITDDDRKKIEDDLALAEESAQLRKDDYQLAYAIDLLRGLAVLEK